MSMLLLKGLFLLCCKWVILLIVENGNLESLPLHSGLKNGKKDFHISRHEKLVLLKNETALLFSDFNLPCFPSFGSWTFDLNLRLFSFAFEAVWWEDIASAKSGPKWRLKNWRGSKSIRVGLSCSPSSSSSISKLSDVTGSGIVLNFLLLDKKTKAQKTHF